MKDFDQSMDQFEQFKEQYLQYSQISQASQSSQNYHQRKMNITKQNEKQKLKIIPQTQNRLNLLAQLNKVKRQKKIHASSGKILGIGDAIFRSNFESGNIDEIRKLTPHHYQITLQKQTNSNRVSAWFYFICEGLKGQIKFTIKGFTKSSSLYNNGMKICLKELCQGSKWRRGGSKISYQYRQSDSQQEKGSYVLNFTHFFKNQYPNSVEFAYCFPYTFSNLLNFLSQNQKALKIETLGRSFEGRQIPLLTIGNHKSNNVIVISSRVHPGETVASLMMEGFLKKLISNNRYSQYLKQNFLFKIVPMINPDGVVHGNYRFSGAGYDLNRKWKCCSKQIHSQVYWLKQMIKQQNITKKVIMYIDLHGHSRQKNIFFYGCCPKDRNDLDLIKPKQFPFLMSRLHSGIKYQYCSYGVQKQKQGTARVCMWKHLQIPYVYTMQASFLGTQKQNYTISDYESVGASLCQGICLNFLQNSTQNMQQFREQFENMMSQFYRNPSFLQLEFNGNSSDSEPQAGQVSQTIRKQMKKKNIIKKKSNSNSFKIQGRTKNNRSFAQIKSQNIIDNSTSLTAKIKKHTQASIKKDIQIQKSKKSKQEDSGLLKTQIFCNIPIDTQEKLKSLFANKRFISQFQDKKSITRLLDSQNKQRINLKKKTVSFQGAQYRRVRKMVQQNNKDVPPSYRQSEGVVGLGTNNFKQFQKIGIKHRGGIMFPSTQIRFKKGISIDAKLKKQKFIELNMQYRKNYVNSVDRNVNSRGRQIL